MMATEAPVSMMSVDHSKIDLTKSEETPGSNPMIAQKLAQGRLFGSPPTAAGIATITQFLQTTPPDQTTPSSTQSHSFLTTPTRQSSAVVTTHILPKSCPPKPKLSQEERKAKRLERDMMRAESQARREEERLKKEAEKAKRELEKKERQERKAWEEKSKKEKREKKEAEKKKKDEERKKADLEKEQAKEEKFRKDQQKKERLLGFFVVKPKAEAAKQESSFVTPFSLKAHMTLAPRPRPPLSSTTVFDQLLQAQDFNISMENSVKELKMASPKVEKKRIEEDDVIEIKPSDGDKVQHSFKLLQFHKNHRPAYYGTWRKSSGLINPRNPFKRDEAQLDYSVDSDDEWEEENPGESISNSEGEDSCEEDEDEEDDGFFVPHGYLSDGEGGDDLPAGFDPTGEALEEDESKRNKMADKAKAWEVEFSRKCQPLKPVRMGCTWTCMSAGGDNLSKDASFLKQFAAVALVKLPLSEITKTESENVSGSTELTRMPVPEEAVPDLIRLMHKSSIGVSRIIKTFRMHWGAKKLAPPPSNQTTPTKVPKELDTMTSPKTLAGRSPPDNSNSNSLENASGISKRQVEKKIHEIAVKEYRSFSSHRSVWYVHEAVMEKYNIDPDNVTPFISFSSPQSKINSTDPPKIVTPQFTLSNEKKRKADSIITLLNMLTKSPHTLTTTPPQPKRIKLQLHVDRVPPTKPVDHTLLREVDGSQDPTSQKRELEEPIIQSAAKRLCLEDATNTTATEEDKKLKMNAAQLQQPLQLN